MPETDDPEQRPRHAAVGDRLMQLAENTVYAAVALLLVVCAVVALAAIGYSLAMDTDDGAKEAVKRALDGLLLVFIVIELFGAVRATVIERNLVAEPFLVVGIIASIKEIVVASLDAGEARGEEFDDAILKIGVLGAVVVVLALASFLVRRKEREPEER